MKACAHPNMVPALEAPVAQSMQWALHIETQYVVSDLVVCSQRSLEDEINRTTIQDLPVFAISYIIVFLYISLALGSYSRWKRIAVRARGIQQEGP